MMNKPTTLFLLFSFLLFTACSLFGGNDEQHPDIPGKLVFAAKNDEGTYQIYSMNANGSDLKQLTHTGKHGAETEPAWSPDGRHIIYSSANRSNTTSQALVIMDADGSNKHLLDKREGPDGITLSLYGNNARWSPDGTKIAYSACPNCELRPNNDIYVYDIAANTHRKLTRSTASDLNPVWSPDGNSIAYQSDKNKETDIYILNLKNNSESRLTTTGNSGRQIWYVDNELIYWSQDKLYRMNLTTGESSHILVQLTNGDTGFRPLSVYGNGQLILLLTFNYEQPQEAYSLQVLDLLDNKNKLVKIYTQTGLSSADWHS